MTNKRWSLFLKKSVLMDLRLHWSWVTGGSVYDGSDREIGEQVLQFYEGTGLRETLTRKCLRKHHNHITNKYGEFVL